MSMFPDDTYDVFILDANNDEKTHVVQLELTITSGAHKGEVVRVQASNLERDVIDLIGLPAQLHIENGSPRVVFD